MRERFGLQLALLFAVLATASFLIVLLLLEADDDSPAAVTSTTATPFSITTTTTAGELTTPTFVAVAVSETDEATARAIGDELTEAGFDSGILRSDDFTSLEAGFWVAYVGPFDDVAGAQQAVAELQAAGYTASYPRCVGTADECS
jgi:hypothetical protein